METETITIPEGKKITLSRTVYKLAEPVEVPASALGAPEKKQSTRMRPFGCKACGFKGRATAGYRGTAIKLVCTGPDGAEHEPEFLTWFDDENPSAPEGDGE